MQEPITRRSLLASVMATLGVSQLPPLSLPTKPKYTIYTSPNWEEYFDEDYTLETLKNVEWQRDGERMHFLFTSSHNCKAGYTVDTWTPLHKQLLWLLAGAIDRWTFNLATAVFEEKTGAVRKGVWSGPDVTELESVARS